MKPRRRNRLQRHFNAIIFGLLFPRITHDKKGNPRNNILTWQINALDRGWYLPNYFVIAIQYLIIPVVIWVIQSSVLSFVLSFAVLPFLMAVKTPIASLEQRVFHINLKAPRPRASSLVYRYKDLSARFRKLYAAVNKGWQTASYQVFVWPLQTLLFVWLYTVLGIAIGCVLLPVWFVFPRILSALPKILEHYVMIVASSQSLLGKAFRRNIHRSQMMQERASVMIDDNEGADPIECGGGKKGNKRRIQMTKRNKKAPPLPKNATTNAMTTTTARPQSRNNNNNNNIKPVIDKAAMISKAGLRKMHGHQTALFARSTLMKTFDVAAAAANKKTLVAYGGRPRMPPPSSIATTSTMSLTTGRF